ncbi:PREDICTED: uncharacterized protein LOC104820128 [Tarenaya hassleriana]|uniref:uncharacterized protein LOC104820128 n=1 Tax=Tarenaya hassleriana TaxID=28532 RepID=UPI00053CA853|nr:PREDICTED: uncharacterized protein LOC104820128 [Tarenaya hassleriana]
MHQPGIEPGSVPWQGTILPLDHWCCHSSGKFQLYSREGRAECKQALSEATSLNGWTTATTRNEEILVDEIVREIESKLFRSSKKKVIFEWTLVIINFVLEIPSAIFDQLSSTRKPFYALIGMVISLLSLLLCVTDMIHKGRVERVVWRWTRPVPWFYYQSHRSIRFGTFLDFFGLLCVLGQCAVTMINYAFISHGGNSPIKISVCPIMFALGLLCTKFINGRR